VELQEETKHQPAHPPGNNLTSALSEDSSVSLPLPHRAASESNQVDPLRNWEFRPPPQTHLVDIQELKSRIKQKTRQRS